MVSGGDKVWENYLRRQAKRLGLYLKKSRAKKIHADNLGGYMIVDLYGNYVVAGGRFELELEDVADFLNQYEKNLKEQT